MTNTTNTSTVSPCHHCNGTGGTLDHCTACHGRGETARALVLCAGCGEYEATRDELCAICDADVMEFLGAGRDEPWSTVGTEPAIVGARYYFGDDEGELLVKGYRC